MNQLDNSENQPKTPYLLEDLAEPPSQELKEYESDTVYIPKDEEVRNIPYLNKLLAHSILTPKEERDLFLSLKSAYKSWTENTLLVGLAAFRVAQLGANGISSQMSQTMIRRSFNKEPQEIIDSANSVVPEVYELVYSNRALLANSGKYNPSISKIIEKNSLEQSKTLIPWNANVQNLENRLEGEEHIPGLIEYASKIESWQDFSKRDEFSHSRQIQIYNAIAAELGIVPETLTDILKDILRHRAIYYQNREEIMKRNQRLVYYYARKFELKLGGTFVSIEDLHSMGNIGLMRGIEKFDVDRGYKFSTYGLWWIKQAVRREFQESSSGIRIPIHVQEDLSKINLAIKNLYEEHQEDELRYTPTIEDIASATGFNENTIKRTLNAGKEKIYLDSQIGENTDTNLYNQIEDTSQLKPYEGAHNSLVGDNIRDLLDTLKPQERKIITLRYGLDGESPRTLAEIGEIYRVTRERIRQIEMIVLKKFRHPTRLKILQASREELLD